MGHCDDVIEHDPSQHVYCEQVDPTFQLNGTEPQDPFKHSYGVVAGH